MTTPRTCWCYMMYITSLGFLISQLMLSVNEFRNTRIHMHFGVTLHFGFPRLYTGGCLRQRTWDVQVSLHTPFGVIATSHSVAPRWTMDFCQPVVPWITSLSEIHFSAICYKLVCSAKIKHGFLLTFVWAWNEANHHRRKWAKKNYMPNGTTSVKISHRNEMMWWQAKWTIGQMKRMLWQPSDRNQKMQRRGERTKC